MKFLVPNYSCLQNRWLGGFCPHIPVLSVLCPQLNLLNLPPPQQNSWVSHCFNLSSISSILSYSSCTFSSMCFANVDLPAHIYSWEFYMLIYRIHYCFINIIEVYSFLWLMVLSAPNLILLFLFLNIFVTTRICWTQQEEKFIHILHCNFEFLSIFRIVRFFLSFNLFYLIFVFHHYSFHSINLFSSLVTCDMRFLSSTWRVWECWYFCAFWCTDRYIRNNQVCVSTSCKLNSSTLEHETSTLSWKFGKETPIYAASRPIRTH
jgi:hypothetical protein